MTRFIQLLIRVYRQNRLIKMRARRSRLQREFTFWSDLDLVKDATDLGMPLAICAKLALLREQITATESEIKSLEAHVNNPR